MSGLPGLFNILIRLSDIKGWEIGCKALNKLMQEVVYARIQC